MSDLVTDIAIEHENYVLEAEHLLSEIVAAERQPSHAELTFFKAKLGWDQKDVNDQYRRISKVRRLQQIAGRPADRKALQAEVKRSASALRSEGPKLDTEIEKLQKKKSQLETAAKQSAQRYEDCELAVVELRKALPEHIDDKANHLWKETCEGPRKELHAKQIRLHEIETLTNPANYGSPALHMEAVQRSCWEAVVQVNNHDGRGLRRAFSPDWGRIQTEWATEAEQLRAEIPELETQVAKAAAEVEKLRSYYSDDPRVEG